MAAEPRLGERNVLRALLALGLAVGVLGFTRLRGEFDCYMAIHRWLQEHGVSEPVRNLDSSLLLVLACFVAAAIAHSPRRMLSGLGLTGSLLRGLALAVLAGLPMLVLGFFGRTTMQVDFDTVRGAIVAPFVEELFFRAMLVGIAVQVGKAPFWPTTILAGLLFGAMHVPWNASLGSEHLGVLLVTTAGGVWFAWILRSHDWNLWTTIGLHAVMNGAWMVFALAPDAAGGLWANLSRAATIGLGTWLTLRHLRRPRSVEPG